MEVLLSTIKKILLSPLFWWGLFATVVSVEQARLKSKVKKLEEKVEFLEKKTRNM